MEDNSHRFQGDAVLGEEGGEVLREPLLPPQSNASMSSDDVSPEDSASNSGREDQSDDSDHLSTSIRSTMSHSIEGVITLLFPRVERLSWWTFFLLSAVCAVPSAIYVLLFTKMGFGLDIFSFLSKCEKNAYWLAGALVGLFLLLYIFDISYWKSKLGKACRYMGYLILLLGTIAFVLFISTEHPYGPICLFSVLTPMWLILTKELFHPQKNTRVYVTWLTGPLFFISIVTLLVWFVWTFLGDANEWNEVTRLADAEESGCEPDFTDYPDCRKSEGSDEVCYEIDRTNYKIIFPEGCDEVCTEVFESCLNTFILWVGPLLAALSLFFLSFICSFLRVDDNPEKAMMSFAKLWMFLLFAMWVTASLVGAGMGLTACLAAFTLAAFVGSTVFLLASFSRDDRKDQSRSLRKRIATKYGAYMDIFRGLLVVTCAPVALIYVGMSFLNQCVRRTKSFPCSKRIASNENEDSELPAEERVIQKSSKSIATTESERTVEMPPEDRDWVTVKTRRQIENFKTWDRSKVFTYAVYWGIGFMTLQVVVAQFTLLFLSWLIEKTSSLSVGAATGIMVAVGTLMFLLPPVPGLPIYMTMGIVIVAIGRDSMGLVWSIVYCCVVSTALKLFACTLQQKMIGENLSGYVSVRQACAINTRLVKAMKLVLSEKGLSVPKVAILVGGPDWPTSVLCGILRLPLFPILVGTLPIVLLVVPTVLTGSFLYMGSLKVDGSPEFPWADTLGTVMAAVSAVVLLSCSVLAVFYLERITEARGDELDALPIDEAVKAADDKAEHMNKIYKEVTQWGVVPLFAKGAILLSLALVVTCCYMVLLFQSQCFAEYELTFTIDENLDGDWTNLILPLGRVALLLFMISMGFLLIFIMWAKRKSARVSKSRGELNESIDATVEEPEFHIAAAVTQADATEDNEFAES